MLKPCLYSMRHGGASADIASHRRTLEQVKVRGRWASDRSLLRYRKEGRAVLEVLKFGPECVEFGTAILKELPTFFGRPSRAEALLAATLPVRTA